MAINQDFLGRIQSLGAGVVLVEDDRLTVFCHSSLPNIKVVSVVFEMLNACNLKIKNFYYRDSKELQGIFITIWTNEENAQNGLLEKSVDELIFPAPFNIRWNRVFHHRGLRTVGDVVKVFEQEGMTAFRYEKSIGKKAMKILRGQFTDLGIKI